MAYTYIDLIVGVYIGVPLFITATNYKFILSII
nr:MAG TPA: hypothetical protein [Caudoviricetes sp.]